MLLCLERVAERIAYQRLRIGLRHVAGVAEIAARCDVGQHLAVTIHEVRHADHRRTRALDELAAAARQGKEMGLAVHAGHGLTYSNVQPVARILEIEELNIGHSVISHALFVGIGAATQEMGRLVRTARTSGS